MLFRDHPIILTDGFKQLMSWNDGLMRMTTRRIAANLLAFGWLFTTFTPASFCAADGHPTVRLVQAHTVRTPPVEETSDQIQTLPNDVVPTTLALAPLTTSAPEPITRSATLATSPRSRIGPPLPKLAESSPPSNVTLENRRTYESPFDRPILNVRLDGELVVPQRQLPPSVIHHVSDSIAAPTSPGDTEPASISDSVATIPLPDELRPVVNSRPMSVDEARVIALDQNKAVRVLGWEPHEASQDIAVETAFFDPEFIFDGNAGKLDEQVSNQLQAFDGGVLRTLQTDFFRPENDELGQMVLQKRLRSGGRFQVGWNTDYQFYDPFGSFLLVNPAWRSRLTMKIEQPLFRGRGADIALADIEVARADQRYSTQEFYTLVHRTIRDVEVVYWDVALTSTEYRLNLASAKQAFRTWKREEKLSDAGRGSLPDTLQAEEQYRRILSNLSDAKNRWGKASRELYRLMGTPIEGQEGFIEAAAQPIVESPPFDPAMASYAVRCHPEYLASYAVVQAAQTVLRVETNSLKPDVAVRFAYAFSGLAENLDEAIDIMADGNFTNWTVGVVFRHPFGRRAELANVRKAHLALNRARAAMDEVHHNLLYQYQEGHATANARMELYHQQFKRRVKAEELLEARRKLYEVGRVSLDLQLRAERALLDARRDEASALSDAWTANSELRYTLGELH